MSDTNSSVQQALENYSGDFAIEFVSGHSVSFFCTSSLWS